MDRISAQPESLFLHFKLADEDSTVILVGTPPHRRPDKVACEMMQIKAALVEQGRLDLVRACVEACLESGHAWVAASVALELQRKGGLQVNAL